MVMDIKGDLPGGRVRRGIGRRAAGFVGVLAASAVLLVACSGSSTSESTSESSAPASASAAPATADSGASSAPAASSTAGGSIEWAQGIVSQYEQRPTQIPVTTPISKPIPEGKNVMFISCGAAACVLEADILKEAFDILGWNLKVVNTDGSPAQMKAAWQQAIDLKVDAVLYTAEDESVFKDLLPQIKANGTLTAGCCNTYTSEESGIDFLIDGVADNVKQGEMQAAWVVQDSQAAAQTLYLNLPTFEILNALTKGFTDAMAANCPDCTTEEMGIELSQFADKDQKIVSYLLAHPDVKYVVASVDDLLIGLPAALKAAGLNDITLVGDGANTTTLDYIRSGDISADISFPYYNVMWTMVDAVARLMVGDQVEQEPWPGFWLLTPDNIPDSKGIFSEVEDYVDQWKAVWGKS